MKVSRKVNRRPGDVGYRVYMFDVRVNSCDESIPNLQCRSCAMRYIAVSTVRWRSTINLLQLSPFWLSTGHWLSTENSVLGFWPVKKIAGPK